MWKCKNLNEEDEKLKVIEHGMLQQNVYYCRRREEKKKDQKKETLPTL